jgi:hypothetical protein
MICLPREAPLSAVLCFLVVVPAHHGRPEEEVQAFQVVQVFLVVADHRVAAALLEVGKPSIKNQMRFKKQIANEIKSNILKLNVQIPVKRAEVEKLYVDKRDMVMFKVKEQEALVNEKVTMAESMKKEIENRIDQEKKKQTDGLAKIGKDALKGLFK